LNKRKMSLQPGDYCVVYMRAPDKLVVVNAHPPVLEVVRSSLGGLVQSQASQSRMVTTFKLHGNLFRANQGLFSSSEDSYRIKRVLGVIIRRLQSLGWLLLVTSDLGQELTNSGLFFRHVITDQEDRGPVVAIAPSSRDRMFLIDMPPHIERELVDLVRSMWGLQNRELREEGGSITTELKLQGTPWYLGGWFTGAGEEGVRLRQLLMEMIRIMRKYNYAIVANISTKGTTDSIFFQQSKTMYGSPEDMFILSLNNNDKIRLITAPDYVHSLVGDVIKRNWSQGVQREGNYCGSHEFKLSGNPWWATGEETVESRYLVGVLLAKLKEAGWEVGATLDVARKMQDKTVFIMRQCPPLCQDWAVIGFHETDKIRLVGGGRDNMKIRDIIQGVVGFQGHIQRRQEYGRSHEWKVAGNPFSGNVFSDQRVMIHLLTKILKSMNLSGWKLVASADVSSKYVNRKNQPPRPLDTHSWFFLKDPDMVLPPGAVGLDIQMEEEEQRPEIMAEQEFCGGANRKIIIWGSLLLFIIVVIFINLIIL